MKTLSIEQRLRIRRDYYRRKAEQQRFLRKHAESQVQSLVSRNAELELGVGAFARQLRYRHNVIVVLALFIALSIRPSALCDRNFQVESGAPCFAEAFTPDHIMASVKVENGCFNCSGAVIDSDGYGTSAAHCFKGIIGGEFTIRHPDGRTSTAQLIAVDKGEDLALWKIPASDAKYHSWVPQSWKQVNSLDGSGQSVAKWEAAGYTSGAGLKYKTVEQTEDGEYRVTAGDFGPGDSGGNVFCNGALVSVIQRSEGPQQHHTNHKIYGCELEELVDFVNKYRRCPPGQQCPPQQPGGFDPNPNIPIKPRPLDPTTPTEPPAPPPPTEVEPPKPTPVDDGKIKTIEQKIEQINNQITEIKIGQSTPGPKGDKGDKGDPGKDGLTSAVDYQLIQQKIDLLLRERLEHLVETGAFKGKDGANGVSPSIEEIIAKLPPIEVRTDNSLQTVDQTVKLGGVLKVPPVRFNLQDGTNPPVSRAKPLGEPFLLQAVPFDKK